MGHHQLWRALATSWKATRCFHCRTPPPCVQEMDAQLLEVEMVVGQVLKMLESMPQSWNCCHTESSQQQNPVVLITTITTTIMTRTRVTVQAITPGQVCRALNWITLNFRHSGLMGLARPFMICTTTWCELQHIIRASVITLLQVWSPQTLKPSTTKRLSHKSLCLLQNARKPLLYTPKMLVLWLWHSNDVLLNTLWPRYRNMNYRSRECTNHQILQRIYDQIKPQNTTPRLTCRHCFSRNCKRPSDEDHTMPHQDLV